MAPCFRRACGCRVPSDGDEPNSASNVGSHSQFSPGGLTHGFDSLDITHPPKEFDDGPHHRRASVISWVGSAGLSRVTLHQWGLDPLHVGPLEGYVAALRKSNLELP
jgi:hypothetical protein